MSTETPRAPYGYMPAKLGGEGMGERQPTDLVFAHYDSNWHLDPNSLDWFDEEHYYTRKIQPGEGFKFVGEWELMCRGWEYTTNGENWFEWGTSSGMATVKDVCQANTILAIRRRKIQQPCPLGCHCERCEKAEQESKSEPEQSKEYPKYWRWTQNKYIYRQTSRMADQEYWIPDDKTWVRSFSNEMDEDFEPITPARAYELTGDKSILEKGGEKLVNYPPVKEPQLDPEPVKSASVNFGATATEIANCKSTELPMASTPTWIDYGPTYPEKGKAFWAEDDGGFVWFAYNGTQNPSTMLLIKRWMYPQGIYQVPPAPVAKTQREIDDEACEESWRNSNQRYTGERLTWGKGFHAAIAYVRGEKPTPTPPPVDPR